MLRTENQELEGKVGKAGALTLWVQGAHVLGLLGVERAHLDLVLQGGVGITVKEHLVDRHVECRDDLLRVADQLAVQVRVKLLEVLTVDVQERQLQGVNLLL